ncbi:MAG TPA: ATP-binding protein [Candidatus Acidoferrales bacterium]|nr:ATP-binding protein [Candidatus Acidoferrales bacterium]
MTTRSRKSQLWLVFGGLLVTLLLAGVFTLGSLDLPFEPRRWDEVVVLYAVSTFIVAALLVFGLVLTRSLLRLWMERRAAQLGSRFRTKMVLGAMAISLLPVVFMFFISYALLNRTLGRWFPRPLEIAVEQSQKLRSDFARAEQERLSKLAQSAAERAEHGQGLREAPRTAPPGSDAIWFVRDDGGVAWMVPTPPGTAERPQFVRTLPGGVELWRAQHSSYLAGRAPYLAGFLVAGKRVPSDFLTHFRSIEAQLQAYDLQKQRYRTLKAQMLLVLFLFTLLLLFAATWFAFFLSKQVILPIQALVEATREVTAGHFDHRIEVQARDELDILVRSFNQMTAQLGDSRRQIDEFTRHLQQAVQELERRRELMEAVLENIPTGVLSIDDTGGVMRTNPAATRILGERVRTARTLAELLGEDAARGIEHLMRRSLRMGAASKELEIALPGRVVHAAVTVSSLGPRRSNPGFVVVVDDLTDLLRAQKAAAWQEVAQRIAHEIKNPLTPIQLSAGRLGRYLERQHAARTRLPDPELSQLVSECAGLIEREVTALESLVNEFSQFARFPAARLVSADPNAIVTSALEVFGGRLEGITVRTALAPSLPSIKADPELLRRVLVNLIDNAAEAVEGSSARELTLSTRAGADGETVEIVVADSGHGISPEDKDKLFLPHFSTKERGTGLGLAIASRIIAEHYGTLHVEDNTPVGARFVIHLPVAEVPAAPIPSER